MAICGAWASKVGTLELAATSNDDESSGSPVISGDTGQSVTSGPQEVMVTVVSARAEANKTAAAVSRENFMVVVWIDRCRWRYIYIKEAGTTRKV